MCEKVALCFVNIQCVLCAHHLRLVYTCICKLIIRLMHKKIKGLEINVKNCSHIFTIFKNKLSCTHPNTEQEIQRAEVYSFYNGNWPVQIIVNKLLILGRYCCWCNLCQWFTAKIRKLPLKNTQKNNDFFLQDYDLDLKILKFREAQLK